jgi:hypothetical protein
MRILENEVRLDEYPHIDGASPEIHYRAIKYMGMITSRNIVVYFDKNKKVIWVTCENT